MMNAKNPKNQGKTNKEEKKRNGKKAVFLKKERERMRERVGKGVEVWV